ncbi:hypothetical protein J4481_00160 [Candidatus Pacearchaeota archaeon]|nr:hypothetical protein [Candidatus Pacearchaeota archaeon]
MDAEKLKWCCQQKNGIKIVKPNENLANDYIKSSEETLMILQDIKGKSNMWLATTKYYCEYFVIYALLQKLGIKCEIHDCTIGVCGFLEGRGIVPKGFTKILSKDKDLRIDNQYYLKNKKVDVDITKLREFILEIKNKINTITLEEITKIRGEFEKMYGLD